MVAKAKTAAADADTDADMAAGETRLRQSANNRRNTTKPNQHPS
jgi:hypothetical protein